jgi:hypothetical protein
MRTGTSPAWSRAQSHLIPDGDPAGLDNGYWLPHLQQESMFWRRSFVGPLPGDGPAQGAGPRQSYGIDFHLWRRFARHARLHTVCSMLSSFAATGTITEKYRRQYFEDAGENPPTILSGPPIICGRSDSFLKAPSTIKEKHLK